MIELSQELISVIMLGGILAGVLTGYPLGSGHRRDCVLDGDLPFRSRAHFRDFL